MLKYSFYFHNYRGLYHGIILPCRTVTLYLNLNSVTGFGKNSIADSSGIHEKSNQTIIHASLIDHVFQDLSINYPESCSYLWYYLKMLMIEKSAAVM